MTITAAWKVTFWFIIFCGKTARERKFSEHRREFHSVFHCDLCNKFYSRNASLRKHANTAHKGHPSITCQICMKTKASKYHLAQHFADIHQLDNTKIPGLQNVQYENHDVAKENIAIAEIEPQLLRDSAKQDLMEKTTKNSFEQNQSKELDADHDDENNVPLTNHSSQKIEEFKCPHCSKGFHNKLAMVKHETTCELRNQKAPTCNICSKIFKNKDTLLKHHTRCHSEYECEICNKKITGKCEIIRHIRFQHPSSYLECKLCKSILRNKKDLLHHLEDHENSFICQFCGDCLTSKIKIRMHILGLHGKILSLSCSICLKMFDTQQVLRDHVNLTHKDRVTSKCSCPVCGKNYCSKWTTFDHINRTHGEVFKACKICLDLFESEPELHNHLQLTHNIQSMETNISAPTKTAGIVANQVKCQKTSKGEQSDYQHDNGSEEQHDEHILEIRCTENEGPKNMKDSASSTKVNKEIGKTKAKKRKVYDNNDVPGTCEFCHKTCPSRKHLWQHCLRYHKEGAATVCGICLKSMPNYEELQMHLREEHPLLLYGQGCGSKFICQICGRYHNSSSKLEKHMIVHEKFDWKIMDRFPPLPKFNYNKNQMAKIRDACSQLQAPDKEQKGVEHLEAIEDINEALIEQVTESSCESEIES
ncbi:PR domain zinc finger protein 15-like isoform X2 [Anthonomus grandis grandis]|uniref:PR domain zinc finger protein 15-like isoform X2 n=1 Tax=Anthonomus grandis grandis TaxID=2921223 RepID=UPI0021665140|nr:PR domain zinc finger protein 15-like isoform X2 [Anthonomus grandis grandis]